MIIVSMTSTMIRQPIFMPKIISGKLEIMMKSMNEFSMIMKMPLKVRFISSRLRNSPPIRLLRQQQHPLRVGVNYPNCYSDYYTDSNGFLRFRESLTRIPFWQGEVIINGNVLITGSSVLEILPGTTIRFDAGVAKSSRFTITAKNSTILARGTREEPILFVPIEYTLNEDDPTRTFNGIILDGPSMIRSEFVDCKFIYAMGGIDLWDNSALIG